MSRKAKPSEPLSEEFHTVELEVARGILTLRSTKERAILASRLYKMYGNPQGGKTKTSTTTKGKASGKEKKAESQPTAANAEFRQTTVGSFSLNLSKRLAQQEDENTQKNGYIMNRILLRARDDFKKPPEKRELSEFGETPCSTTMTAKEIGHIIDSMGSLSRIFNEDDVSDKDLAPMVKALDVSTMDEILNRLGLRIAEATTSKGPPAARGGGMDLSDTNAKGSDDSDDSDTSESTKKPPAIKDGTGDRSLLTYAEAAMALGDLETRPPKRLHTETVSFEDQDEVLKDVEK